MSAYSQMHAEFCGDILNKIMLKSLGIQLISQMLPAKASRDALVKALCATSGFEYDAEMPRLWRVQDPETLWRIMLTATEDHMDMPRSLEAHAFSQDASNQSAAASNVHGFRKWRVINPLWDLLQL